MTDPTASTDPSASTPPVDSFGPPPADSFGPPPAFDPPPPAPGAPLGAADRLGAARPAPGMAAASHTAVAPPRTRWAGIVWGAFFATVAALALWILPDESRRTSAVEWASSLDATTGVAMGVLAVGVVLLVAGLSGVLRRAQRRWGGN